MIQKLIKGRYLEFGSLPFSKVGGELYQDVQELTSPIFFIKESESLAAGTPIAPKPANAGVLKTLNHHRQVAQINLHNKVTHRQQSSQIVVATNQVKLHRNFTWLEWIPGKVTFIRAGSVPVLTGPMSGCWITAFTRNHVRYIAHIGTAGGSSDLQTQRAKAAWARLLNDTNNPITSITGFNPFREFDNPTPGSGSCFAVATGGNEFVSMYLKTDSNSHRRLITGVKMGMRNTYPVNHAI